MDVRRARSDERVATAACKIRISPQFWRPDKHEVTRRLLREPQNLHFTTVLDIRRARSDERVVSRLGQPNPPCVKKKIEKKIEEVLTHSHSQHNHSQQIFSAQPFSADLLSRSSQLSCCCGQGLVVSYWRSTIVSSDCCGQGLVVRCCLIICCGQGLVVSYFLHHLLWSGVGGQLFSHHLLWSGVGGQLLSHRGSQLLSHHGSQLLSHHVGQFCTSSLQGPFRGAFGKK